MLDQSFSVDNFKQILEYENRKGNNLEKTFFPEVFEVSKLIGDINKQINRRLGFRSKNENILAEIEALEHEKTRTKVHKDLILTEEVRLISEKLHKNYKIELNKIETDNKPFFTIDYTAENYFAVKQLQYNIKKSFGVKQANRFSIINQIKELLVDNFPKIILRTDVKGFYESIPHDKLLHKINDNPILSFFSKKLISGILTQYREKSGSHDRIGIPRGVGISAFLAEIYMREIDREIQSIPEVTYYARYVDDIIVIFTPTTFLKTNQYTDRVKFIIEHETGLKINEDDEKTKEIELIRSNKEVTLNFLGYKFEFENVKFVQIKLTEKKLNKYRSRIIESLKDYNKCKTENSKLARRLLIHRLNFLTSNTRLENNKDNVVVGIYYSNSLLSKKLEDLVELDSYLYTQIDDHIADEKLRRRLKSFSFKDGFQEKKFFNFSSKKKKHNPQADIRNLVTNETKKNSN